MTWLYHKMGITVEPLCCTSQNKCHPHLPFIDIMYSNFHLDVFTTLVYIFLDWKRQHEDDLSSVFTMSPWYLKRVGTFKTLHNRIFTPCPDKKKLSYSELTLTEDQKNNVYACTSLLNFIYLFLALPFRCDKFGQH